MTSTAVRKATPADAGPIRALLGRLHLPLDGLEPHLDSAVVADADGTIVGCAALEIYTGGALLRSVAVDPAHHGRGLGAALARAALGTAAAHGIGEVFLLTTTAEGFFPRFGFERVARDQVPADVRQSVEFVSACPASAIVMRAQLWRGVPATRQQ